VNGSIVDADFNVVSTPGINVGEVFNVGVGCVASDGAIDGEIDGDVASRG
jgi:hypothetical protein